MLFQHHSLKRLCVSRIFSKNHFFTFLIARSCNPLHFQACFSLIFSLWSHEISPNVKNL